MNEITDNDGVIGILFEPSFDEEFDECPIRRGYLYLHPDQFGKRIGNLEPNIKIRFYCRQAVQSKSDLIVWADVTTKKFEPQLQDDN